MRACPPVLVEADARADLPRLGGMARPDGVVIVSDRYWAFAGRDGSVREGVMPGPGLDRTPPAGGFARWGAALPPLFRRWGVAAPRGGRLLAAVFVPRA